MIYAIFYGEHVVTDNFIGVWLNHEDMYNYLRDQLPTPLKFRYRVVVCQPNKEIGHNSGMVIRTVKDLSYVPMR
jgi:hypothetical protein